MKGNNRKVFKVLVAMLCVVSMLVSLAGCGKAAEETDKGTSNGDAAATATQAPAAPYTKTGKVHKIGIAHYTDAGKGVEAIKAFLDGIADDVECEFVYTTLSTYDEATNKTKIQELISAGCEGILMSADMGTKAILEECKSAGVYLGGFLCDFNLSKFTTYDDVFTNEYFVGSVNDGELDKAPWGEQIADQVIQGGYKNIGVIKFPAYAYPLQADIDNAFRAKIAEYNATAADADKINLLDTIELNFTALDDTYLTENQNLDAIFSIAAGASNVYPVLVAAGRTDIKLFTTGFEGTDDSDNFRSSGNGCYQSVLFSQPEALVYSLCQVIDKINGVSYSDAPASPEVVSSSNVAVNSDEDMNVIKEKSMYYTADFSKSLLTGTDVAMLCKTYNPDATYAKLCEVVQQMGVEDLAAK